MCGIRREFLLMKHSADIEEDEDGLGEFEDEPEVDFEK